MRSAGLAYTVSPSSPSEESASSRESATGATGLDFTAALSCARPGVFLRNPGHPRKAASRSARGEKNEHCRGQRTTARDGNKRFTKEKKRHSAFLRSVGKRPVAKTGTAAGIEKLSECDRHV